MTYKVQNFSVIKTFSSVQFIYFCMAEQTGRFLNKGKVFADKIINVFVIDFVFTKMFTTWEFVALMMI